MPTLDPKIAQSALDYLGVAPAKPDLALLDRLIAAYIRRVSWESASRIVKRANTSDTADCPRWADEFWQSAIDRGTGGTCFESNNAFFALLSHLGFDGYLTINNMQATIGCHTAIVLNVEGDQRLTDAGFPVHGALRLDPTQKTEQVGQFYTYSAQPEHDSRYTITRDRHPAPYCFTLINAPVEEAAYRAATTNDYGENGLFLDKVIISRVIDEQIWRFTAMDGDVTLESFDGKGHRVAHPLGDYAAAVVAKRFAMDQGIVDAAIKSAG